MKDEMKQKNCDRPYLTLITKKQPLQCINV